MNITLGAGSMDNRIADTLIDSILRLEIDEAKSLKFLKVKVISV